MFDIPQQSPPADVLTYQTPRGRPTRSGIGFMAVCATILLPGLGHVITGFHKRGAMWFAAILAVNAAVIVCAIFPPLVPGLLLVAPIAISLTVWSWIDAYRCSRRTEQPPISSPLLRWLAGFGFIVAAALMHPATFVVDYLQSHYFHAYRAGSGSMLPTLASNDRFFVHRNQPLPRWSLVAFHPPDARDSKTLHVKRIVGMPGDTVAIAANGELILNGLPTSLPEGLGPLRNPRALIPVNAPPDRPLRLGADEYFVVGDNSVNSYDSRLWRTPFPGHELGALPASEIYGRVTSIYWPPSRWKRFR